MLSSRTFGVLVAFLVSLSFWPNAVFQSGSQTSPADEAVEQLMVTASDGAGNPVSAPAKDSLRLRIGGREVEIQEIRSLKDTPLAFSLLVDVSGSSRQYADQQIKASSELFRALSSGGSHGFLILFKSEIVTSDRFLEPDAVEDTLRKIPPSYRAGRTSLYDAIDRAIKQLTSAKLDGSRKAIFIFSDGGDNSSHKGLGATVKLVQNANIPVYSVGFSKDESSFLTPEELGGSETLQSLSHSSGGTVSFLDEPGDVGMRIARLMDGQWLVSFKRPALKPGKFYGVKIESSNHKIRLFAPSGYSLP